ncbi:MAG TPA: glycosyltransferase family 87 protein [Anaerolineales bacterium]|nr:glycosyltransferase family 87 protein [Anaerolineales bacterium]
MMRTIRTALICWGVITGLILFEFIWVYSRHGLSGFENFMQEAPYTQIPITLASVAMTWLLAGFLLWLLLTGRITKATSLSWAGFFIIAFLYLNVLRERVRYGDIDYYTQAAFALLKHKPLPDTYFYPPLWATLLSFLTPFGENGILLVAWIANVLSLLLFYFLLQRTLELYQFKPYAAALTTILFVLVNMPVLRTFMYVQVNFHVMNFILLSLILYKGQPFLSALMLALAVHFKASPVVLVFPFLLEFNWKWLTWFVVNMVLIAGFTIAIYGVSPYYDFINNFLFISAPHGLSMHDSSFDSAIGMTLSYLRVDFSIIRILVLLAKGITALVVVFSCVRSRGFFSNGESQARLFDSIIPLFVGMTLLSPLVWEHHALFLTLPFLLLLKKLESPGEWILYGTVYLLVFLTPTFDYFPWSYGRLLGILILLGLLWSTSKRIQNTFFAAFNAWAESLFSLKVHTKAV